MTKFMSCPTRKRGLFDETHRFSGKRELGILRKKLLKVTPLTLMMRALPMSLPLPLKRMMMMYFRLLSLPRA
jgi:hypothetical protein